MLLAQEKGAYELFHGSDWENGSYFDARGYFNSESSHPWLRLFQDIQKFGIRNGYLMAVAPNSSTSLIAGSSASIDPIFFKSFIQRRKKDYKIPVTAPDLNAETTWYYKSAYFIDQHWSIRQNEARQRHIDQSISFNLYVQNNVQAKELLDLHLHAWKAGLKTSYYLRSTSTTLEDCDSCSKLRKEKKECLINYKHARSLTIQHQTDQHQSLMEDAPIYLIGMMFRFSWAYPKYKKMLGNFWTPFEINMSQDIKQFPTLSKEEQDAFLKIIGLLALLDSIQTDYAGKVADYLTDSSLNALMIILAQQEVIHNHSYSYVLSSIVPKHVQDEVFEFWRTEPVLEKRNEFVTNGYAAFATRPSVENLLKSIVFDVILEGLFFYSGFAFFL